MKRNPLGFAEGILLFVVIFGKEVVGCTFKNVAECFEVFKLDRGCLVFNQALEVLIADTELDIEPIACFPLFCKDLINTKMHNIYPVHYMMCTL